MSKKEINQVEPHNYLNQKIISLAALVVLLIISSFYAGAYRQKKYGLLMEKTQLAMPVNETTKPPLELMNDEDKTALKLNSRGVYEVVARNNDGTVESYRLVRIDSEVRPVTLEWMIDEEKFQKGLATSTRVQVLERNSQGEISAYKIINEDSEILDKY